MSETGCNSADAPYMELRPDDGTWTAPILVSLVCLPTHGLLWWLFPEKLGRDLLEECTVEKLKDTVCKAYEVNSVTTALIMTTVAGLLVEGHEMAPQYFCLNSDFLMHLRQTYVAVCIYCLSACILCVVLCTLNFFYLNSLSPKDAQLYLTPRGGGLHSVGETMIFLVEAYILFAMAISVWVGTHYGAMHWIIAVTLLCSNGYVIKCRWRKLSQYNAEKAEERILEKQAQEGRHSFDENFHKRNSAVWLQEASKKKLRDCHPEGHWLEKETSGQTSRDNRNNSSFSRFTAFGFFSKSTSSQDEKHDKTQDEKHDKTQDEKHDKTGKKGPPREGRNVQFQTLEVEDHQANNDGKPRPTLVSQSSLQSEWWDGHRPTVWPESLPAHVLPMAEQLEKRRGPVGGAEKISEPMPAEDNQAKKKLKQKRFKKKATQGPHRHASSSPKGPGLPLTELPALAIV